MRIYPSLSSMPLNMPFPRILAALEMLLLVPMQAALPVLERPAIKSLATLKILAILMATANPCESDVLSPWPVVPSEVLGIRKPKGRQLAITSMYEQSKNSKLIPSSNLLWWEGLLLRMAQSLVCIRPSR